MAINYLSKDLQDAINPKIGSRRKSTSEDPDLIKTARDARNPQEAARQLAEQGLRGSTIDSILTNAGYNFGGESFAEAGRVKQERAEQAYLAGTRPSNKLPGLTSELQALLERAGVGQDEAETRAEQRRGVLEQASREGFYTDPSNPYLQYTGRPSSVQGREFALRTIGRTGERPTTGESSSFLKGFQQQGGVEQYLPGSTMFELGFANSQEYLEAQRVGSETGPAYGARREPPPFQPSQFSPMEIGQFTDNLRQTNPLETYAAQLGDYLSNLSEGMGDVVPGKVGTETTLDPIFAELNKKLGVDVPTNDPRTALNNIAERAEKALAAIQQGGNITPAALAKLPFWNEIQGTFGADLTALHEQAEGQRRSTFETDVLGPEQADFNRRQEANRIRGPQAEQPVDQFPRYEQDVWPSQPEYFRYVTEQQLDPSVSSWMLDNYNILAREWQAIGEEQPFIPWVTEFLANGGLPTPERPTQPTRSTTLRYIPY